MLVCSSKFQGKLAISIYLVLALKRAKEFEKETNSCVHQTKERLTIVFTRNCNNWNTVSACAKFGKRKRVYKSF